MSRQFDLIVFDWDGTLMDSTALIVRSLQAACADLGLPVPDDVRAAHVIGLSLADAIHYLLPDVPDSAHQQVAERYRYHFLTDADTLVLFDGVPALLASLHARGHQLAVATGKARRGLDRVLLGSGIEHLFVATRCADESFSKPHPGMLLELMDECLVEPSRTLMIGDTTHDLQMARNAGTAGLAVSYGAHPLPVLQAEAPLAIVHDIPALQDWLACNG
ncbi:HAD-IIIA family hydrolase [Uliginosibacterium sp. H1]|uniref:HAD-IIIA family hydrolase n=1 Tax=Uliginosibacterium sp. H1 TaxID=3114757 RepID=UPI002E186FEC|nr:HAD-IIIA family hydrolase [Uliginosibacterium sp. H1]